MPSTQPRYQVATPSLPLAMPGKSPFYAPLAQPTPHRRVAISPPSAGSSVNTSAVPSLTSGSYAGSASGDHENLSNGTHGVDLIDMMTERLSIAVDPLLLDRSIAKQAQTSGELNAKNRELLELQATAQRRLKGIRPNVADGMKAANEVKKDLQWTQKRVSAMNAKTAKKYPSQYKAASARYPAPVDN